PPRTSFSDTAPAMPTARASAPPLPAVRSTSVVRVTPDWILALSSAVTPTPVPAESGAAGAAAAAATGGSACALSAFIATAAPRLSARAPLRPFLALAVVVVVLLTVAASWATFVAVTPAAPAVVIGESTIVADAPAGEAGPTGDAPSSVSSEAK